MHQMGQYMQVITITHLPQVAAKGSHHFKVFKETKAGSTFTQLKKLSLEDRIEEVAQMLSGEALTTAALQHAKRVAELTYIYTQILKHIDMSHNLLKGEKRNYFWRARQSVHRLENRRKCTRTRRRNCFDKCSSSLAYGNH